MGDGKGPCVGRCRYTISWTYVLLKKEKEKTYMHMYMHMSPTRTSKT